MLLTPSCTASLEMAALLIDIQPGDEVIAELHFVSTANAFCCAAPPFVRRRASGYAEYRRNAQIEAAITPKTRAIVPVHYAAWRARWITIMALAAKHSCM